MEGAQRALVGAVRLREDDGGDDAGGDVETPPITSGEIERDAPRATRGSLDDELVRASTSGAPPRKRPSSLELVARRPLVRLERREGTGEVASGEECTADVVVERRIRLERGQRSAG